MDLRVLKTRAAIKSALLTCLTSRYFSEITISAICETAKCSRSTFYAHYDSKKSVMDDIISEITDQIQPYIVPVFNEPEAFLEIITSLSEQLYSSQRHILKLLMDPEFKDFGLEASLLALFKEQFLKRFPHLKGKELIAEMYSSCVLCNIKAIIENRSGREEQAVLQDLKSLLFEYLASKNDS